MNLRRWDVVFVPVDSTDKVGHPAVVISPPDLLENVRQQRINVLTGTKKLPAESPQSHQVLLNGADGLEFSTLLNCSLVYQVRKTSIIRSVGSVAHARRGAIATRVRSALGVG